MYNKQVLDGLFDIKHSTSTQIPHPPPLLPPTSYSNSSISTSLLSHPLISTNVSIMSSEKKRKSIFITYNVKDFEARIRHPLQANATTTDTLTAALHPQPYNSCRSRSPRDMYAGNAFMAASMGSPILSEIIGHIFNYSNPSVYIDTYTLYLSKYAYIHFLWKAHIYVIHTHIHTYIHTYIQTLRSSSVVFIV